MRYRIILTFLGSALLMGAAGPVTCSQQALDDEARVVALIAQIRAGAAVAAQDIQSGLDLICSNSSKIADGAQNIKNVVSAGGPGPKTSQNLNAIDKALTTVNTVCSQSPGTAGPTLTSLILRGWTAYLSAKDSANKAQATASSGT